MAYRLPTHGWGRSGGAMRFRTMLLAAELPLVVAACGDDDDGPANTPAPTGTLTSTGTVTRTVTRTPTVTPTFGQGANITFIGLLRADNTLLEPAGTDDQNRQIFDRPVGSGFIIVVEASAGPSHRRPG